MSKLTTLFCCFVCAVLVSVPSLLRLPTMLAFANPIVRADAPLAMAELRSQGLWLSDADIQGIQTSNDEVCFDWRYAYQSRMKTFPSVLLPTCVRAHH